ncbi:MAG: hypothetical protein NTX84_03340 [Nitrospirae bacterium]|nr:hypothetical protein [Nitrospirota bacterium]
MSYRVRGILFTISWLLIAGHWTVGMAHTSAAPDEVIRSLTRVHSDRVPAPLMKHDNDRTAALRHLVGNAQLLPMPDLSGEWEILEVEDDKRYKATLDKTGNGPYTQQGGQFVTSKYADRLWQGTWHQPGNDREGGFEVVLSEDGTQAKGQWWYSRVGSKKNIPPREHGGTYQWKRLTPVPPGR